VTKLRDQVAEFHRAFGVPVLERPQVPPTERLRLRLRLVAEEFLELLEASGAPKFRVGLAKTHIGWAIDDTPSEFREPPDIIGIADALADLDYVIEGTRLECGINGEPIADEVHRSNMAKLGGTVRVDGKILKPAGWTAPDILGCLRAQGLGGAS
jgi:predicted HAD superfamily Cof-like phosphohydrolase